MVVLVMKMVTEVEKVVLVVVIKNGDLKASSGFWVQMLLGNMACLFGSCDVRLDQLGLDHLYSFLSMP